MIKASAEETKHRFSGNCAVKLVGKYLQHTSTVQGGNDIGMKLLCCAGGGTNVRRPASPLTGGRPAAPSLTFPQVTPRPGKSGVPLLDGLGRRFQHRDCRLEMRRLTMHGVPPKTGAATDKVRDGGNARDSARCFRKRIVATGGENLETP
jgi:hypothetical protein